MTTHTNSSNECPAEALLKTVSGKWKAQILLLATKQNLRFNTLLRQLEKTNKQSLSVALKELENDGFLRKEVIREKPLHIEYVLTEKGKELVPVFKQLETLNL